MVRWRAAQEYASLLADKTQRNLALDVYLAWLTARQLESEVISGFAVLQCVGVPYLPDFEELCASIGAPSLLADITLELLYGAGRTCGGWENRHSGAAPPSYKPSKFFIDHVTAHVPGHLSHRFEWLEKRYGPPLMKQWAFEWQQLMDDIHAPSSGYPYFFVDNLQHRTGINGQFSQRQCDVYRSSFLRTVAWAVDSGMPRAMAEEVAAETIAVNGGFVKLKPIARPVWLQDFPERCVSPGVSLASKCKNIIASASSSGITIENLKTPISWGVEKYAELRLSAILATEDLQFNEFSAETTFHRDLWVLGNDMSLNCILPYTPVEELMKSGQTGTFLPLTIEVWPTPHGFWHNDYYHTGLSVPAPFLGGPSSRVECREGSLDILSDENTLGQWRVWHDHWSNLYPEDGHPRCGMMTTLDPSAISAAAANQGLRLGWIAELNVWRPKSDYSPLELSRSGCFFFDE